MKQPDFLIVGAAKSGTTSLCKYLESHSGISMSKPKEPRFLWYGDNYPKFKSNEKMNWLPNGISEYASCFAHAKSQELTGEGSTIYLFKYKETIENIKKIRPDTYHLIKIIIILRDPVSRIISQYKHFRKQWAELLSFEEAIQETTIKKRLKEWRNPFFDYLSAGLYSKQVAAYKKEFNCVHIIDFNDFKSNPSLIVEETLEFLWLKSFDEKINSKEVYNQSFDVKKSLIWVYNTAKEVERFFTKKLGNPQKKLPSFVRKRIQQLLWFIFWTQLVVEDKVIEKIKGYYKEDIKKLNEILSS